MSKTTNATPSLPGLVTAKEAADIAGIALETLRVHRKHGRMPDPVGRVGWALVWDEAVIREWAATRRRVPGRVPAGDTNGE